MWQTFRCHLGNAFSPAKHVAENNNNVKLDGGVAFDTITVVQVHTPYKNATAHKGDDVIVVEQVVV